VDFRPLVGFMKYLIERYGIGRFMLGAMALIVIWRTPELLAAIRWW